MLWLSLGIELEWSAGGAEETHRQEVEEHFYRELLNENCKKGRVVIKNRDNFLLLTNIPAGD